MAINVQIKILWYHRPISILHRPHCTLYTNYLKFDIDQLDFTYTLSIGIPLYWAINNILKINF